MSCTVLVIMLYELQRSTTFTEGTCKNIGGYYIYSEENDLNDFTTTETYTTESSTADSLTTQSSTTEPPVLDGCYYESSSCSGRSYNGQCYTGLSSQMSCPSCNNIGGVYRIGYGCYYYSNNCSHYAAGGQCHTHRCCKHPHIRLNSLPCTCLQSAVCPFLSF